MPFFSQQKTTKLVRNRKSPTALPNAIQFWLFITIQLFNHYSLSGAHEKTPKKITAAAATITRYLNRPRFDNWTRSTRKSHTHGCIERGANSACNKSRLVLQLEAAGLVWGRGGPPPLARRGTPTAPAHTQWRAAAHLCNSRSHTITPYTITPSHHRHTIII